MPRKRLLWVDDDLLFYQSYREELARLYKVEIAKSPEVMWQLLDEHLPDYYSGIILDVLLPYKGMDVEKTDGGLRTGLTLLEMLKGTSKYAKMPVMLFSIRETADVDEIGEKFHVPVFRKSEVRIAEFLEAAKKEFGI
jgi:DNA-binding response OmpR family regulator